MINVYYLSLRKEIPNTGYWDYGFVQSFFAKEMPLNYKVEFKTHEVSSLPKDTNAIVVVPARHHAGLEKEINKQLSKIVNPVLFLMGDEEASFSVEDISCEHIWVQNPHPKRHDAYLKLPTGFPPQLRQIVKNLTPEKTLDVFFSGQLTHNRRQELADNIVEHNSLYNFTQGFTQGFDHQEYYEHMLSAKMAPAPSGAVIPDSFRLFEALECMAIPIADQVSPDGSITNYWDWLTPDAPFPKITTWRALPDVISNHMNQETLNRCIAWWIQYKQKFSDTVCKQLHQIPNDITVVIPSSPIPSHPSTAIIEETIDSVRQQLPEAQIIITFDGVRDEQQNKKTPYNNYIGKLLWKCLTHYTNVVPIVHDNHSHQSGMLERLIPVTTDLLLYVEHDTPLTPDRHIEWDEIVRRIKTGEAHTVRLHHENVIPKDHEHLMLGSEGDFTKTAQWSQRPHVSSVAYYKDIILPHLKENGFIEDQFYRVVENAFVEHGLAGWNLHKTWIYTPKDGIQRSYHLDGRAGTRKFTADDDVWGYVE